jgi:hypothetical protein
MCISLSQLFLIGSFLYQHGEMWIKIPSLGKNNQESISIYKILRHIHVHVCITGVYPLPLLRPCDTFPTFSLEKKFQPSPFEDFLEIFFFFLIFYGINFTQIKI